MGMIPSVEWWVGTIGTDDPRNPGMYTNVNTLILRFNCRDVVTSFPGTPEYFNDEFFANVGYGRSQAAIL